MDFKLNNVHIWNVEVKLNENQKGSFIEFLSHDEKERADKFKFHKDRQVYIVARGVLRLLSGFYLKRGPKSIEFRYSEYGRPSFLQDFQLDFNVSHSGNRVIIGFSKEQIIGVDIEKIKQDFDPLELAKNFFSKEEIKALSQTKEAEMFQAFYRCWTRKESFIKAVGEGLSYPLDSFAVSLDDDERAQFININRNQESKRDWQLHSFVPAEGYIAAITTMGNPNKIEYFNANDLI